MSYELQTSGFLHTRCKISWEALTFPLTNETNGLTAEGFNFYMPMKTQKMSSQIAKRNL